MSNLIPNIFFSFSSFIPNNHGKNNHILHSLISNIFNGKSIYSFSNLAITKRIGTFAWPSLIRKLSHHILKRFGAVSGQQLEISAVQVSTLGGNQTNRGRLCSSNLENNLALSGWVEINKGTKPIKVGVCGRTDLSMLGQFFWCHSFCTLAQCRF